VYKHDLDREYEASIAGIAVKAMNGRKPLTGPLLLSLQFRIAPPASTSKRLRAAILDGEVPFFGKYDVDNLTKGVMDALNGVCWVDDRQVIQLIAGKHAHEKPGIDVTISEVGMMGRVWLALRTLIGAIQRGEF
jgi:Holliday junction resolvase RusA-like endonuclease